MIRRRISVAAATLMLMLFQSAEDIVKAEGLCMNAESSVFTCRVRKKLLSLCASATGGTVSAVTYRYGVVDAPELVFTASSQDGNRFSATAYPASPDASLRQIWFDDRAVKYVVTQCVGGDCIRDAGIAAIKADKVVFEAPCAQATNDTVAFRPGLVRFGSDSDDTVSATPLVVVKDEQHPVERLYVRRKLH